MGERFITVGYFPYLTTQYVNASNAMGHIEGEELNGCCITLGKLSWVKP